MKEKLFTLQRWVAVALFAVGLVVTGAVAACGPANADVAAVAFPMPSALVVGCANPPADLEAELWISGFDDSCPLTVDVDEGTTVGECVVTTGRERTLTVDWYVIRENTRVLLAQARDTVDLTSVTEETVAFDIADGDIEVLECLDVRDDKLDGVDTQTFDGEARPVCDLDNDCGGTFDVGCSNVGEICAGADPLAP